MFPIFKNSFVIGLLTLLIGCVSVPQMQDQLEKATIQTSSISEMQFTPLQTAKEQSLTFGEKSPTYQFKTGKGYYAALSISDPGQPRILTIKTYITSSYLPSAAIMVPNILVLDSDKKQIGKIENYRLESDVSFFAGPFYYGEIPLPEQTAYLVVYAALSKEEPILAYSENGHEYVLPLAPAGNFTITAGNPLPKDFEFSKVIIKDSVTVLGSDKADFFYVESVDGKTVKNSLINTIQLNQGKGFHMDPYILDREIPANKAVSLNIVGKTHYGAPIQEIFNKVYEVKGQITFTPLKGKRYVVTGDLNESGSAVWIEDEESHELMGKKIELVSKTSSNANQN